jgi:Fe2+ transport system protein FeoA
MVHLIPLSHLRRGTTARIAQLVGGPEQVHRLEELGLRQGTQIEMVANGSPCIVKILGSKFCFRATQLLGVLVQPEDPH